MNFNTTNSDSAGLVYSVSMEARDHECDIQGVVNNAHYQHYFEHARHRFLLENEIDFAALAQQNINLMVSKIEIEYLGSIVAHDQFYVTVGENKKLMRNSPLQKLTH